jgi:hypothetical protein
VPSSPQIQPINRSHGGHPTCDKPEFLETLLSILLNVSSLLQFITGFQELEQESSQKNIAHH